jgi:hypothetical protein
VRGFKILWRAIRDTFDQILSYMLGSLLWWVVVAIPVFAFLFVAVLLPPFVGDAFLIIGAALGFGPATALLAKWTDPRLIIDRPALSDLWPWAREYARRAWIVAGIVLFVAAILTLNLTFFSASQSAFSLLVPLWAFLLILSVIVLFTTLAIVALLDVGPRRAFRLTGYVIASAPFQSLLLVLWIIFTIVLGLVLVVPLVLLTPPLIMAATNRLVLQQLEIEIIDPNAPTDERVVERKTGSDRRAGKPAQRGGLFRRS